jgi:hypothetical protein
MAAAAAPTAPAAPDHDRPASRSPLRSVALPTEHGGWSLTAEPALLGLLVAWSWSGLALGLAAMAAFVARTPLKLVLVDLFRRRWLGRTRLAAVVLAGEAVLIASLLVAADVRSDGSFWWPFAIAAPLVVLELWFDMRSRSRRLLPELAGTVGIGSVAAAIALAAGAADGLAVALWCVVAARGVTAIPYVRTQVLRLHRRPHARWHSDLAQLAAVLAVLVGWSVGDVPLASVGALGVVAAVALVQVRAEPRPPRVLGVQQMVLGLMVTLVTAAAAV